MVYEEKRLPGRDARADFAGGDDRHRADALLFHVRLLCQPHPAHEQGAGRLPFVPRAVRRQGRLQGRNAGAQREDRDADHHFQATESLMRCE